MIFLTVGDVHLSDTTPASRLDNYTDATFEDLALVRAQALEQKATAVFITGDIFDRKSPIKNSHAIVARAIALFSSFPCPVYSIVGNHDIVNNRMDSLSRQPLNVLFESGALKRLKKEVFDKVTVHGVDFDEGNDYSTLSPEKDENSTATIAVCHVLATPDGGDMYGEPIFSYKKLANSDVDVYVFGHFHNDQGIHTIGKKKFVNLGALSRGSLTQEEIHRQVKIGRIEWDGKSLECSEIPLAVKSSKEIFDIEKKQEMEKKEKEIESFVASLNKTDLFQDISSLEETIKAMRLETGVKNRLVGYLNNKGAEINV